MFHIRWSERRGSLQAGALAAAFPPARVAKRPMTGPRRRACSGAALGGAPRLVVPGAAATGVLRGRPSRDVTLVTPAPGTTAMLEGSNDSRAPSVEDV